jgi:GT2 family glycosyltransferase
VADTPLPFSIVVATHDRPRQLAACLEAMSALDYPRDRFEVIVVDDGSTRGVAPVVEPFQDRLSLRLERRPLAGPGAARNAGAEAAVGEILAFTDDDCLPTPGWLRGLADGCRSAPGHAVGGRTLNALRDNPFSETTQLLNDVLYDHYNAPGRGNWFFGSHNLAVPIEGFRAVGGFRTDLVNLEDRDLCERWAARGFGMAFAPDAVVYHAHELTLRGFMEQHFSYGRGAFAVSRARAGRTARPPRPELDLHIEFFRRALARGKTGWLLGGLVALSQAVYFAGFTWERLRPAASASWANPTSVAS